MSTRLALGVVAALAGLAALSSRRGSRSETIWYHCGSRPPGESFDIEGRAGTGEGAVSGDLGVGGAGIYLTDNIDVARIYCRYAEQPFLSAFKLRGELRYGGGPEGYFPTTPAGRDALLAQGFVGAAQEFKQPGLPYGSFTEIVVYDPAALIEVSSVPTSTEGRTRPELRAVVRQQMASGRSTHERPSRRRLQAGAQLRQLRARGSRAALLQQLPEGWMGTHSQDAQDHGVDLVVQLVPALRGAIEVIEDLYDDQWKQPGSPLHPRRLLEETGLRSNDRVVVISFIEVPHGQRFKGIGTASVQRIERWARARGAKGILLRSGMVDGDHPAGFWDRMGYYEVHLHDDPVDEEGDAIMFKGAARFSR